MSDSPKCRKCGGATSLRYIDYGNEGADLSYICVKVVWIDGFPQECKEAGEE